MLPYSLGSAFVSAASGQIVTKTGRWRPVMWFSWVVITRGYGLMIQLDDTANEYVAAPPVSPVDLTANNRLNILSAKKVLYLLVAALGIGCLFQVRLLRLGRPWVSC